MDRTRELTVLSEISAALNEAVELGEALETTLEKAGELLDLETGWVWLLESDTGNPYLAASRALPPGLRDRPELMEGECYCLNTFERGDLEGAANINVVRCSRLQQLTDGTGGFAYHASVPLYGRDDEKLGVLNLATRDFRELDDDELQLLQTVSELVAMAVQRTQWYEESRQLGAIQERNRLARDIHDTIAQGLSGLVMQLESADAMIEGESRDDTLADIVDRALELARENLEEARRSVRDLRAAPLDDQSLPAALERLVERRGAEEGWEVALTVVGGAQPLDERIETALYRIVQESLTNIAQHADATDVSVALTVEPDDAEVVVSDDGTGFDPASLDEANFGLVGMRERTRRIGGEFSLESSWTEGTSIVVSVPLDGEERGHDE